MRRSVAITMAMARALPVGAVAVTHVAARVLPAAPLAMAADQADLILAERSARRMHLMRAGDILVTCRDLPGGDACGGAMRRDGDGRATEGSYVTDRHNPRSVTHLSPHIAAPSADDRDHATAAGAPARGNIMIHGLPNGRGLSPGFIA